MMNLGLYTSMFVVPCSVFTISLIAHMDEYRYPIRGSTCLQDPTIFPGSGVWQ